MARGIALLNIAHHQRSPQAPRAAYRLLGVFDSVEAAQAHLGGEDLGVDVHAAPTGDFVVLMRAPGGDERSHRQRLLEVHRRRLRSHADEFEANRSAQRAGAFSDAAAAVEAAPPPTRTDGIALGSLGRHLEVRMQRFAVVSVLDDHEEPAKDRKQPGLCVYAAFDTEAEAKEHARDALSKEVMDHHLDVVAMYEWIFPTEFDLNEVHEEYRVAELNDIMTHRKQERRNVEAFRQLCARRGEAAPEIVLGSGTPAPVCTLSLGEGAEGTVVAPPWPPAEGA
jgi:hypothetical protein